MFSAYGGQKRASHKVMRPEPRSWARAVSVLNSLFRLYYKEGIYVNRTQSHTHTHSARKQSTHA